MDAAEFQRANAELHVLRRFIEIGLIGASKPAFLLSISLL
jgi:hypothetical protein